MKDLLRITLIDKNKVETTVDMETTLGKKIAAAAIVGLMDRDNEFAEYLSRLSFSLLVKSRKVNKTPNTKLN